MGRTAAICVCLLVVGMSGTAAAGGGLSAKAKKQVKKIATSVVTTQAATLTVQKAKLADRATSAGTADSATTAGKVNGVSIEPVSFAMQDGAGTPQVPIDILGTQVEISCTGGISMYVRRGPNAPAPPIIATVGLPGGGGTVFPAGYGNGLGAGVVANETISASIREASGRVTRLELETFYAVNAYGGPEDCFGQGTIQRFGP